MGTGYTYRCRKCLETGSLSFGSGILWYDFENVKGYLHWQFRRQLELFESLNGHCCKDFALKLYTCPKCKTIHSRFWLKATAENGEIFENNFKCPKCKRKLAEVDEDNFNIADYACQSCGAIELEYFSKLLWD